MVDNIRIMREQKFKNFMKKEIKKQFHVSQKTITNIDQLMIQMFFDYQKNSFEEVVFFLQTSISIELNFTLDRILPTLEKFYRQGG